VLLPWCAWAVVLPLGTSLLALVSPTRAARWGVAGAAGLVVVACAGVWQVVQQGPQRYRVGGWGAPLGIDLYVDGLSAALWVVTALVGLAASLYATRYFVSGRDSESAAAASFWPLWMLLWTALNALFLSADLFNVYVALELLGLSAVGLVVLAREPVAVGAALRYLLVSLLGSLSYLLGVALIYAARGSLDIQAVAGQLPTDLVAVLALAATTAGLALKTALFPMHFWLPPAHAAAPAPVSALLSALVVKASFYVLLRLWFEVFPAELTARADGLLGMLGVAAVLWGSVQALSAARLKLVVAYSTVAQVGYLFLIFPLVASAGVTAWAGGIYLALSHACAKAAMFLSAGAILRAAGHDRVRELDGISQSLPVSMFALALAGMSLIGLPPSGGFVGKWMLLSAALRAGEWWWAAAILGGSLLAAAYVFRVLSHAFNRLPQAELHQPVPPVMEWAPLALALVAIGLGLFAREPLALLRIGASVLGPAFPGVAP
jgi:multicomponent Na+:H+ antiporter subunit D